MSGRVRKSTGWALGFWLVSFPVHAQHRPDAGATPAKKPVPVVKRPTPGSAAVKPPDAAKPLPPAQEPSHRKPPPPPPKEAVDQDVIEHMEMLELMDLLSDYDLFEDTNGATL